MGTRTDDEILEDLKDWPVRNIYVERGVKLIEQLRQRVAELESQMEDVRRAEREKVIEKCIELGAIERDGVFAEEIREME